MRSSAVVTASTSTVLNSRGSLTQPARSLCTLRSVGHPITTQHSVPAGGQPLPGGIGDPPGRSEGFRVCYPLIPSPLPRLRLAQRNFRSELPRPPQPLLRRGRRARGAQYLFTILARLRRAGTEHETPARHAAAREFAVRVAGACPYQPRTYANTSGATIVASDSMMKLGVSSASLPHVIFSFGTAPL